MNVRDTSKLSFEQIRRELSRQCRSVVDELIFHGPRDWSLQEIRLALSDHGVAFDIRTVSRTVYDLKKHGAAFERSKRRCTRTNRTIIPIALRCFYAEEYAVQQKARLESLGQALREETKRCECTCCLKWRARFKDEINNIHRRANPT